MNQPKKPVLIIGLDPSLTNFASVCLNLDNDDIWGSYTLKPKKDGLVRVRQIIDNVLGLIKTAEEAGRTAIVVREDYAFAAHSSSDTPLKELGGILEYQMWDKLRVPLYKLSIASIKKFMFGKGNAKKQEMMRQVYKHFKFEADEHQTDAFAAAMLAKAVITGKIPSQLPAPSSAAVTSMRASGHPLTLL